MSEANAVERPDRAELHDLCRQVLDRHQPITTIDDPSARASLWGQAVELGWAATLVPESCGGMGWGWQQAAAVAIELGRACAPGPFLSSALIAPSGLRTADGDVACDLLAGIATGAERIAVSGLAPHRQPGDSIALHGTAASIEVGGRSSFVVDAPDATVMLVIGEIDGRSALTAVRVGAGVEMTEVPLLDQSRTAAAVTFGDARADVIAVGADARMAIESMEAALALGVACDARGGAEAVFDAAVDYAKNRVQFGRQIGSFQAIKHRLADLYVLLQGAIAVVESAVEHADSGDAPSAPSEARVDADLAVAHACDAFGRLAGDSILVHGAIGFTWEHTLHRYLKRALLDQQLAGSMASHRVRHLERRFAAAGATS